MSSLRLWFVVVVVSASAGCGGEASCVIDSDVVGIALADQRLNTGSTSVALRAGETVEVCMFGSDGCTYIDQRFEFRSDAPAVITATTDATAAPPVCNQLASTHTYPCCPIRSGRLRAVGAGTAHVEGVLSRGSSVEKAEGLMWCPPFGAATGGCRRVEAIDVTP
jgi:hypothetical protein